MKDYSLIRIGGRPGDTRFLGMVAGIMLKSDYYMGRTIAETLNMAREALLHDQLYIVRDEYDTVCAFVAWAWLSEEVEARILATGDTSLHASEWNEGDRPWIIAFACTNGRTRQVVRHLRATAPRHLRDPRAIRFDRWRPGMRPRAWRTTRLSR